MENYEETIKHLAELYKDAAGDKLHLYHINGPLVPGNDINHMTYAEKVEYLKTHPTNWPDFSEYDRAMSNAIRDFGQDWFKINKDTLDYIYGRLTFD